MRQVEARAVFLSSVKLFNSIIIELRDRCLARTRSCSPVNPSECMCAAETASMACRAMRLGWYTISRYIFRSLVEAAGSRHACGTVTVNQCSRRIASVQRRRGGLNGDSSLLVRRSMLSIGCLRLVLLRPWSTQRNGCE